jgi:hypothetical protein
MEKGQAAMEFLMTYGWAILVVLAGIGALAYFGVLDPGSRVPETCIFFPGLSCNDFKVDVDKVTLVVTNGLGTSLDRIQFTVLGPGTCQSDSSIETTLSDGQTKTFVISCTQKSVINSAFRRDLRVSYTSEDGLDHNRIGNINTKVQSV